MEAAARHQRVADGRERIGVAVDHPVQRRERDRHLELGVERQFAHVGHHERALRVLPRRQRHHLGRPVAPGHRRGPDQRRHLAVAAADVEHAGIGRDRDPGRNSCASASCAREFARSCDRIPDVHRLTITAMEMSPGRPPFAWAETVQYSQSVAAGDLVFTAGQGGFDDDGNIVEGGIEAQVRQPSPTSPPPWRSRRVARRHRQADGLRGRPRRLRRVQARPGRTAEPPFPAGTAVQATLLIDGMLFEMDAVAVRGGVRRAQ